VSSQPQPSTPTPQRESGWKYGRRSAGATLKLWGSVLALASFVGYVLAMRLEDGAATQEALLFWGRIMGATALGMFVGIILIAFGFVLGLVRRNR
jgi:hypothetical protein